MLKISTKFNKKDLENVTSRVKTNFLKKSIIVAFVFLSVSMSIPSVFALEVSSYQINAIGMSKNEESTFLGRSYYDYDSIYESDFLGAEIVNTECSHDAEEYGENENSPDGSTNSDDNNSNFEYIKRIKKPEFKKWCEQNIELIKKENIDRNKAYKLFYNENNKVKISEKRKKYYAINKKQIMKQHKEYVSNNKVKIKEQRKEYYEINKRQIREMQKKYNKDNHVKISTRRKDYYVINKDRIKEQQKNYYEANKNRIKERQKIYNQANKDRIKEQKKQYRKNKKDKITKPTDKKVETNALEEIVYEVDKETTQN